MEEFIVADNYGPFLVDFQALVFDIFVDKDLECELQGADCPDILLNDSSTWRPMCVVH